MESALNGLSQMAILIIVAVVGFLAAKLDYLDEYTNQKLTKLLLNITLPCMVVASVHGLSAADAGETVGITFAMAIAQGFLLLLVGWLLVVLRVPKRERVVYQFVTICNNTGFLGLPVVGAILGSESVIYASIYVMVLAVFVYGVGFVMLAKDDPLRAEYGEDAKVSIPWRSIVNPSMIASVLALVLFFTGWQVPELVQDSLSLLGGITAPIAMLVVGVIVARSPMKNVVKEVRLYPYMIIRQLILLALFYWGFTALGVSPLLAAVFMLMFAMPAGSMCPTFVAQYNGNAQLAAKATIITTVGSFVFIPPVGRVHGAGGLAGATTALRRIAWRDTRAHEFSPEPFHRSPFSGLCTISPRRRLLCTQTHCQTLLDAFSRLTHPTPTFHSNGLHTQLQRYPTTLRSALDFPGVTCDRRGRFG